MRGQLKREEFLGIHFLREGKGRKIIRERTSVRNEAHETGLS